MVNVRFSSYQRSRVECNETVSICSDSNVTCLTPTWTPRVANDPVFDASFVSKADSSHCVIVLPADAIEDATAILHKGSLRLDVDCHRSIHNGKLRIQNIINLSDSRDDISWIVITNSLLIVVWI
jgi:hypothetical protein